VHSIIGATENLLLMSLQLQQKQHHMAVHILWRSPTVMWPNPKQHARAGA
jgi:hypothetical protein